MIYMMKSLSTGWWQNLILKNNMGKTITTYLIDGTPKGVQTVVISNRTMIAYNIPRTRIEILREEERKELRTPALYILMGEDETGNPKAYIGETENFDKRVRDHINKKDFWQRALVFVSLAHDKTKADVQYLEKKAVELSLKVNQQILDENKQNPKNPTLMESQRSTDDEYFEDIRFVVSFMGYNIFEKAEVTEKSPMFYIIENGILAKGIYDDGGMTVLEGSKISVKESPKFRHPELRAKMIKECCCEKEGDFYIVKRAKSFPSPSGAAVFCLGRSSNGWSAWISNTDKKKAKTLDQVYRIILDNSKDLCTRLTKHHSLFGERKQVLKAAEFPQPLSQILTNCCHRGR